MPMSEYRADASLSNPGWGGGGHAYPDRDALGRAAYSSPSFSQR
jgi:hypothetical protein